MFFFETLCIRIDVFLMDKNPRKGHRDAKVRVLVESIPEDEWPVPVVHAEGVDLKEGHITIWIKSLRGLRFGAKQEGWSLFDPIKAPYEFQQAVIVKAILGALSIRADDSLVDAAHTCLARIAELGTVVRKEKLIPTSFLDLFEWDEDKTAEWVIRYKNGRRWKWKGRRTA